MWMVLLLSPNSDNARHPRFFSFTLSALPFNLWPQSRSPIQPSSRTLPWQHEQVDYQIPNLPTRPACDIRADWLPCSLPSYGNASVITACARSSCSTWLLQWHREASPSTRNTQPRSTALTQCVFT